MAMCDNTVAGGRATIVGCWAVADGRCGVQMGWAQNHDPGAEARRYHERLVVAVGMEIFKHPRPTVEKGSVRSVRRFLSNAGVKPDEHN